MANDRYLAVGGEVQLFEHAFLRRLPVMLTGPTGCGKTRLVEHVGERVGRPVVTMRTGFTSYCPVGDGLFDYASHDEALAAIDALAADYGRHCRAARDIAGDCFGAAGVLADLTAAIGF